jgi:uncharacterized membrane protein
VTKGRMEAFSDGVLAIIITIMVLALQTPKGKDWSALAPLLPILISYVLSFIFVGTFWNNHHHLLQAVHHVDGRVLWANLHLLFWLSLTPFVTAWMGEQRFAPLPVALYGAVMFFAGCAYFMLTRALVAGHGKDSAFARALGSDVKGKVTGALYAMAVPLAFLSPWIACAIYVVVAIVWFVPDRRFERVIAEPHGQSGV